MHLQQHSPFKLHSPLIMTLILPSTALIVMIDKCIVTARYASFKTGDKDSMRGCTMHWSQPFGKITQDFCAHLLYQRSSCLCLSSFLMCWGSCGWGLKRTTQRSIWVWISVFGSIACVWMYSGVGEEKTTFLPAVISTMLKDVCDRWVQ